MAFAALVFGFFRDRHARVVAAVLLHVACNACYVVVQRLPLHAAA